jgi:hypothetical protein
MYRTKFELISDLLFEAGYHHTSYPDHIRNFPHFTDNSYSWQDMGQLEFWGAINGEWPKCHEAVLFYERTILRGNMYDRKIAKLFFLLNGHQAPLTRMVVARPAVFTSLMRG